jgi:SAM-dependent methyltransferase
MGKKEWFEEWFNSPYYHLLYGNRDAQEAEKQIDTMLSALGLEPQARVLDLACGKGRHAIHLAHLGFDVTGLDISGDSIAAARLMENETLAFYQHDMRLAFRSNYFDAVLNMFTSFGYFKTLNENQKSLQHIFTNLKPGGALLLDYFNSHYVRNHLVPTETKTIEAIQFDIEKKVDASFVYKTISFTDQGREFIHQEKVQLLEKHHFEQMCTQVGLQIESVFGDYDLSPFQPDTSKRFIFIARKP